MPPFVFICGGRRDQWAVQELAAGLRAIDVPAESLIWDRRDSSAIPHNVQTAIRECAAFVPIVSGRTVGKRWLNELVRHAILFQKLTYPLKLEDCRFSEGLRVMQYEWFNRRPSPRWFQRMKAVTHPAAIMPVEIVHGHEQGIWSMAYDRNSGFLATGSWDGTVRIRTRATPNAAAPKVLPQGSRVLALAYSPSGAELAVGCEDGSIRIWSTAEQRVVRTLLHEDSVRSLAYNANGDTLFSASVDGTARVWERWPDMRSSPLHVVAHDMNVLGVACVLHGPGTSFATVSEDTTVRVWNNPPIHAEPWHNLNKHTATVWGVAYSPTDEQLATVSRDRTARIWDVRTGEELKCIDSHDGSAICVAYSPDGRFLATGSSDETARIWEIATGRRVATFIGHSDAVRCIAFAPHQNRLTTASADGLVIHWDLPLEVSQAGS